MNRDDIIRMAREAGATFDHMTWVERDLAPVFERFAALVAAAERKKQREPLGALAIADIYIKWDETPGASMADFARAIEAAHGIKEQT